MGHAEVVSTIALLVATVSLYFTLGRPKPEPSATEKAFKRLESDVESVFEKVESHLGRISRLKRGAISTLPPPNVPKEPERARTRGELLVKHRRNYAQSDSHGPRPQRAE